MDNLRRMALSMAVDDESGRPMRVRIYRLEEHDDRRVLLEVAGPTPAALLPGDARRLAERLQYHAAWAAREEGLHGG